MVKEQAANGRERQITDHASVGTVIHTIEVRAQLVGRVAVATDDFHRELFADVPVQSQVVVIHITDVVGLCIARALTRSGVEVGEALICPRTVVSTPTQELIDHAVNGRSGQREEPVLNRLSQSTDDRVDRRRTSTTVDSEVIGETRLKQYRCIRGVETYDVQHLGALINRVVRERVIESQAIGRHPARRQTVAIPIHVFKSTHLRVGVVVEIVTLTLINRRRERQRIAHRRIDAASHGAIAVVTE